MSLRTKIGKLFKNEHDEFFDFIVGEKNKELHIKSMAINKAIDLIARTISKCKIKVYRYDKKEDKIIESKDNLFYRLNMKVNPNETGSTFFYRLICKLIENGEALVVTMKADSDSKLKYLYLAENDFKENQNIMYSKTYSNVSITDGQGNTLLLNKEFKTDEVLYFSLGESKIKDTIDKFYNEYGRLLSIASRSYKTSNIHKFRLKTPGGQPALKDVNTGKDLTYDEFKEKVLKGLFDDEETIIMLSEIFELSKITGENPKTATDYRELKKEAIENIASMFSIPLDIFKGDKTSKSDSFSDYMTFAVDPIIEIIEDTLNVGLFEEEEYLKGEYVCITKHSVKHFDILDVTTPIDKLSANGWSHDEILDILDMPLVNEDWAKEHRFTKNYADAKGGDDNGEK